jgi:hypothetical protein
VPTLLVEVTQAREAAVAAEAIRVVAVLATETSAQEAAVTQDSTVARVKDVEDQAALAEREDLERVSRKEVESATVLASAHEEIEGLVRKNALLEGELAEVCKACEVTEENARGLSDAAADAERWWLERPSVRICDLLFGPPSDWARLADRLGEAIGQLGAELASRWEADIELEAL